MGEKGVNIFGGGVELDGGTSGFASLKGKILLNVSAAAAAGTTLATATQLETGLAIVTGADATKGVKLPATPTIGELCIVVNADETNALEVYPGTGDEINTAAASAPFTVAAMGMLIAVATSPSQWYATEPAVAVA